MGCCQSAFGEKENQNLDMISIVNAESYDFAPPLPGSFHKSFDSSFSENLKDQGQAVPFLKSLKEATPNFINLKSDLLETPLESISQQQILPVNPKTIAKPLNLFGGLIQSAFNEVKEKGGALEIDKNFMHGVADAEKMIEDNAQYVGGVIKDGYEQSAVLAQSQVALLKEGLDDAIHAIEDLKIKKRLHNIVYPVLRKVFVHSVACEIETKYDILNILGKGSFSTVKKVLEKSTGIERAAKIIVKSTLSDKQTENLISEVEILKQLDHQNIVRVVEIVEEVSKIFIITELCAGGELFERIIKAESFDELMASKIMYQILSGLVHIHKNGYIHLDLKPENLMFMDQELSSLKIIDFGITKGVSELSQRKSPCVGSAYYISPEAISGNYDFKSDVWSCGVILFILLCGKPPFPGCNEKEIFSKISRGVIKFSDKKWRSISKEAKELVLQMLNKDLTQRLSAAEAFAHPWVQNAVTRTIETKEIPTKIIKNLEQFVSTTRLQQATLSFIATSMFSAQEIKELREAFIVLDTDGDGHLTRAELQRGFSTLSLSASSELEDILASCDIDMNGMIDYSEFLTGALDWQKHLSEEILENAFRAYDTDHSGSISIREIKQFLGVKDGEPDDIWNEILQEADENGDGEVSMGEFKALMRSRI